MRKAAARPASLRAGFRRLVEETGWRNGRAGARLLCLHLCVEGATVGPHGHVFRDGEDVVRGADLPAGFAVVLAGHGHRHQVLRRDLRGRAAPDGGAVRRLNRADVVRGAGRSQGLRDRGRGGGRNRARPVERVRFERLPTRPMAQIEVGADWLRRGDLSRTLPGLFDDHPGDAVVRLRIRGPVSREARPGLTAEAVRRLVPPTMNLSVRLLDGPDFRLAT